MLDPAPVRLPAAPPLQPETELSLAELVGELTAAIACLILRGVHEFKTGGQMGASTRRDGGTLVAGILELRRAFGDGLVSRLAREHGSRLLREQHGDADPEAIDRLVAEVIVIVDRIAQLQMS
jgi:hypothetical protein